MNNVVALQRWYYPLIVRIVMDSRCRHHTTLLECSKEHPNFFLKQLQDLFKIETAEDWLRSDVERWDAAVTQIELQIALSPNRHKFTTAGYFITVRPVYGEVEVQRYEKRWFLQSKRSPR